MELGIFSLYYITNNFHYKFQKEFKRIQKVSDSWKIPFFFFTFWGQKLQISRVFNI